MKTSKSDRLFREASALLVGGVSSPVRAFKSVGGNPVFIERGRGPWVWDVDGNRYIDFVQSYGAVFLGHANPLLTKAVTAAARRGTVLGAPVPEEIHLARSIRKAFPMLELIRFVNSGTEATMSAVRAARGFTGRSRIVKFAGCYHGHSDGLLAKAGSGAATLSLPDSSGVPASFVAETRVVPYNDVEALRRLFAAEGREIAAVIVEPIAANMGLVRPRDGFLREIRRMTSEHGTVLIFDEVISGFRVRHGGAVEWSGIRPDLVCLGKIMGGGLPVGAYGGGKDIMECVAPLGPVYQAGTLAGNRAAMACGAAAVDWLATRKPYLALEKTTQKFAGALAKLAESHGYEVQVPWVCGMFTLFFSPRPVVSYEDALACDRPAFSRFFHAALANGLYVPPSPFEACFVSPFHTKKILAGALKRWEKAFRDMGEAKA
ncbi:MAG: glutamate-1-semialdehyde 2,1-aminomutase [Nitrospirae bacterium]|nr:glutamate-1-semialdehyde 2,1-aminomutase [Nitrospirota bacterium]